jgi:uncharacterized protein YndB with AHSA1/START domain
MALYHFVTDIHLSAPREPVWELIVDPSSWPGWWRWLKAVEVLEEGDAETLGHRARLTFGTALPYSLSFETEMIRAVRPSLLESQATGELAGTGRWELSEDAAGTKVRYTWIVETTKRWMNAVAPIARPAFSWNHDVLMRDFATGFARVLQAELSSVENRTVRPGSPGFGRLPEADLSP